MKPCTDYLSYNMLNSVFFDVPWFLYMFVINLPTGYNMVWMAGYDMVWMAGYNMVWMAGYDEWDGSGWKDISGLFPLPEEAELTWHIVGGLLGIWLIGGMFWNEVGWNTGVVLGMLWDVLSSPARETNRTCITSFRMIMINILTHMGTFFVHGKHLPFIF